MMVKPLINIHVHRKKAWVPGTMKSKEKKTSSVGGKLRIFSSFSRGKAGILGGKEIGPGSSANQGADPVLLRVKKRDEEDDLSDRVQLNPNPGAPESSRLLLPPPPAPSVKPQKSRQAPTRSYSLSGQSAGDEVDGVVDLLPAGRGVETLPKLSKQIQTSPKPRPTAKQKRLKSRKLTAENPANLVPKMREPAENEIERFEREFVRPMLLNSQKLLKEQGKVKSSDDLLRSSASRGGGRDNLNTSLPPMHLQEDPTGRNRIMERLVRSDQQLPTSDRQLDEQLKKLPEQLAELVQLPGSGEEQDRVPSSTNSLVSDSNYDSGAFSRTSTPEIVHGHSLPNLPPLASPPLVLALIRTGQAKIVDGQLVLACLNAAGARTFDLKKLGSTGGVEITTAFQSITDSSLVDTVDAARTTTSCTRTSNSSSNSGGGSSTVTISIGTTTKLHVNEESNNNNYHHQQFNSLTAALTSKEVNSLDYQPFQSLTNISSVTESPSKGAGRQPRDRNRIPHMGTLRLGTPPMERLSTTNNKTMSLERNKISTVFLPSASKSSTPKSRSSTLELSYASRNGVHVGRGNFNNSRSDILNFGFASNDDLHQAGGRSSLIYPTAATETRAGSCSSHDESSGVSSAGGNCDCGSLVTVNGQHHCANQSLADCGAQESRDISLAHCAQHASCEDTLSLCPNCDMSRLIVHV